MTFLKLLLSPLFQCPYHRNLAKPLCFKIDAIKIDLRVVHENHRNIRLKSPNMLDAKIKVGTKQMSC